MDSKRHGAHALERVRALRWRRMVVEALWAGALLVAGVSILVYRIGDALAAPPEIRAADAIVVLGGEWPERIQRGVDLFHRGLAPELWITGDRSGGSTATMSVDLARRAGVPADSIRVLPSDSTWEDGGATAALAARENARSVLVVTSWYHSRRALCVMKQRLSGSSVALYHDTVGNRLYGEDSWWHYPSGWYWVAREAAGFAWYWVDHGLAPWEC